MNRTNAVSDRVLNYIDATFQELGNKIILLHELKCNVDVFQKTGQLACAIIRGMDYLYGGTRLPKLVVALSNASNMPNLWACLRLPYSWIYSVTYANIHEYELRRVLHPILSNQLNWTSDQAKVYSDRMITEQLKDMSSNSRGYKSIHDFKKALENRINKGRTDRVDLGDLNLRTVYRPYPFLTVISTICFNILDMMCVPLCLMDWNLNPMTAIGSFVESKPSLSALSNKLGEFRVVQWIAKQELGTLAWGTASIAFGVQMLESARRLHDEDLSPSQKLNTQLTLIASATELVFCTANFIKARQSIIISLAILAKGTGIVSIACQNPIRFFDNRRRPN